MDLIYIPLLPINKPDFVKMKILFTLLLLLPIQLSAQEVIRTDTTTKYVRPKYYELGAGFNFSTFRDFATSPLIYSGLGGQFVLGILRKDNQIESNFTVRFSSGVYTNSNYPDEKTPGSVSAVFLNYGRLYRISPLSSDKWNFKVGGKIDLTGNLRQNQYLLNSGVGVESFQTLFASVKVTRDISRKTFKEKKFLFFRYKRVPQKRELSFQLNPSVINNTFRNGYAYIGQSGVTGTNNLFDDYKFSTFSGFRINTALDYTRYLKNGNGIKFSYIWDAYKTGGSLPKFEMSHHIVQVALLFRVK